MITNKQFVIYKLTCLINNKIYIGCSSNFHRRMLEHKNTAKRKPTTPIDRAIGKHGYENFIIEIIQTLSNINNMNLAEMYWIAKFDSRNRAVGYNIMIGGGSSIGIIHTLETRTKMSLSGKGRRKTSEEIEIFKKTSHTKHKNSLSKYLCVFYHKTKKRWFVQIYHEKQHRAGPFNTELEAAIKSNELFNELNVTDINNNIIQNNIDYTRSNILDFKPFNDHFKNKRTNALSQYLGVYGDKRSQRSPWVARAPKINGKQKYLGSFSSEKEAAERINIYCIENNILDKHGNIVQNIID